MSVLSTFEHKDVDADVLVVTNTWPVPPEWQPQAGRWPWLRGLQAHPRDGIRYGIFVKRQVDSLLAEGLRCDVLFIRGYMSPLAYLAAALRLMRMNFSRKRYRVVHGHGGETLPALLFYWRAPRLVSFCGDDLLGTPGAAGRTSRGSALKGRVLATLTRFTAATITKSAQMQHALPAASKERNHVVPNGVDREFFQPIVREEARRRLGWSDQEFVALFAADPEVPRKRHALAVATCDRARKDGLDVRLEVADHVDPKLMPVMMSAADCLLMTSAIEGSPNVVKEAAMCNLPVIATRVGDVDEVLSGVSPSWVCDDDPEALARAVTQCAVERIRSNGRVAAAWLDKRDIAARLLSLYTGLSASSGPTAARSQAGTT